MNVWDDCKIMCVCEETACDSVHPLPQILYAFPSRFLNAVLQMLPISLTTLAEVSLFGLAHCMISKFWKHCRTPDAATSHRARLVLNYSWL